MLLDVKSILRAPGKRLDFQFELDLSDLEFSGRYPVNHPVEVFTFLCGNTGKTFINVPRNKGPSLILFDEVLIICNLVVQGVELLVLVGGYAGIEGHAQGQVVYGAGFQLLADESGFHRVSFRKRRPE